MKLIVIVFLSILSISSFAGIRCSGSGLEIDIDTSNGLSAEIRHNGRLVAQTDDVSDISAFDVHYIGNFKRSSFDLRIDGNNKGTVSFDNYPLGVVSLQCQ